MVRKSCRWGGFKNPERWTIHVEPVFVNGMICLTDNVDNAEDVATSMACNNRLELSEIVEEGAAAVAFDDDAPIFAAPTALVRDLATVIEVVSFVTTIMVTITDKRALMVAGKRSFDSN